MVKYCRLISEVSLSSFVLQLFALVTPLFFRLVTDKVLVPHSMKTINEIAIGLVGVMVVQSLISGLRRYVFTYTASRIYVELGSKPLRQLVTLPLAYFQARRIGHSVALVRELENTRIFHTDNAITLVLDLLFSVVFLGMMFYYSGWKILVSDSVVIALCPSFRTDQTSVS